MPCQPGKGGLGKRWRPAFGRGSRRARCLPAEATSDAGTGYVVLWEISPPRWRLHLSDGSKSRGPKARRAWAPSVHGAWPGRSYIGWLEP